MLVEVTADSEQPWAVLFANEAWEQAVKRSRPRDGHRAPFWDIFQVQQPCNSLQHRPCNGMSDGREGPVGQFAMHGVQSTWVGDMHCVCMDYPLGAGTPALMCWSGLDSALFGGKRHRRTLDEGGTRSH